MISFEKITNVVVILAAVAVGSITIYDRLSSRVPDRRGALAAKLMNKPLKLPDTLEMGSRGAVAVFISKNCRFCSSSMGFYRSLVALKKDASCDIKLFAIGPKELESVEDIEGYVAKNDLKVDGIEVVDFSNLEISGTPTLVLIDHARQVKGAWLGSLEEESQHEVTSKVQSVCKV